MFFPIVASVMCFKVSSMLSRESGIAYILAIRLYYFFVKHSRLTGLVLFFQRTLLLFRVREFIPEYFISLVSVCVVFSLFLVDLFVDSHSLSLFFSCFVSIRHSVSNASIFYSFVWLCVPALVRRHLPRSVSAVAKPTWPWISADSRQQRSCPREMPLRQWERGF